ncbi:hypothetical protein C2857_001647 [Epichloe festucae Fl1]|uniref:Uncharacterized protein n=1 Tax=Epichloe festucae (strain Fl1) TaxID=877507 RepID=A0A7U3Q097_EPIFF|nr:hypothetical protein C2857_001647 [Epichloe festucae Fl1]
MERGGREMEKRLIHGPIMKSTAYLLFLQLAVLSMGSEAGLVPPTKKSPRAVNMAWDHFSVLDEKCGYFLGGPLRDHIAGICWHDEKLMSTTLDLNGCLGNSDGVLAAERKYVFPERIDVFAKNRARALLQHAFVGLLIICV